MFSPIPAPRKLSLLQIAIHPPSSSSPPLLPPYTPPPKAQCVADRYSPTFLPPAPTLPPCRLSVLQIATHLPLQDASIDLRAHLYIQLVSGDLPLSSSGETEGSDSSGETAGSDAQVRQRAQVAQVRQRLR